MTPARIAELRALVAAGTSGDRGNPLPWSVFERRRGPAFTVALQGLVDEGYVGTGDSDEIEALIVAAVNELEPLLDEVERLRGALERIERWHGEFPPTGRFHESGEPQSYSWCFGSNGERDFMRGVARQALEDGQ